MSIIGILKIIEIQEDDMDVQEEAVHAQIKPLPPITNQIVIKTSKILVFHEIKTISLSFKGVQPKTNVYVCM